MTNLKTSQILVRAKELIKDPESWIQGDYSKTVNGKDCYCAMGAIGAIVWEGMSDAVYDWTSERAHKMLKSVTDMDQDVNFAIFNDDRTHAEVIQAFDKAIEKAKAEETLAATERE